MNILNKRNRDFTLIEILIFLIILTGIVVMLTKSPGKGHEAALAHQTRIDMNGRIKTAISSKAATLTGTPQMSDFNTHTALRLSDVKDPFGQEYKISVSGNEVTIAANSVIIPASGKTKASTSPGKAAAAGIPNVVVDIGPYLVPQ
jgi:hypothetical protein